MVFTIGLLITGVYQYNQMSAKKTAKPKSVSGGAQADEDSVPRRQARPASTASSRRSTPASSSRDMDDDDSFGGQQFGKGVSKGVNGQKKDLNNLQKQLAEMEEKINGGGGNMAKMME